MSSSHPAPPCPPCAPLPSTSFRVRPAALEVCVSQLIYMIGAVNYPFPHKYTPNTPLSKVFTSVSQSAPTENITRYRYSTAAFENELQCLKRKASENAALGYN